MIAAVVLVQFVGIPCSFLFGGLSARFGAKRLILAGLAVYCVISALAYAMTTATHFVLLGVLVALVQGGTQALSRSLFASLTPRHKTGEFFSFFGIGEKFAGIFGPLLYGLVIRWTGSAQNAILSVLPFYVVGGFLLLQVDIEENGAWRGEAEVGVRRA